MPTVELTIRPRSTQPLEAAAWYLPGRNTARWLEEISHWPVEHTAIQLIQIRDASEFGVTGAVAIPSSAKFTPSGWCVALGRLEDNLYLPIDAELFPTVPRGELADLLADDYIYIWIPGRGLTAAEPEDVLRVANLIELPPGADIDWSLAVPGVAFPHRLVAILPDALPSFDEVIDEGRDDIGERASEIKDLPKAPNESHSGITGAAMRAAMTGAGLSALGIGKLLSAFGNLAGAGGDSARRAGASGGLGGGVVPGMGDLANFANDLLRKVSKSLEVQRHKEINRLLHMLDSDPDQGLKFAIPFGGGGGAHRGLAMPGGHLGMRNVNFSLGHLGGGGAADFWNMSAEYQQQLITKYRELAARETRLGRHRRAAYVYAELLGDMRSAASALEQGHHFREAAILYRHKLNDAPAAAECLERGELWNEAIEAYRSLGRHEKVGDLLTHIELHEEAAVAYHTAAGELKAKQELLGAARVYSEKLDDHPLALDTLDAGWPDASQAKACVMASFAMRAKLGWHEAAKDRVSELFADIEKLGRHAEIAELLAAVFETYPESGVQNHSLRLSRSVVFERMRYAEAGEMDRLVTVLTRLDPQDRLVGRDGRRFATSRRQAPRPIRREFSRKPKEKLQLAHSYQLGQPGVWRSAVVLGEYIVVAGIMDGHIGFSRLASDGEVRSWVPGWTDTHVSPDTAIVLHCNQSRLRVFAIGERALPDTRLLPSFRTETKATIAGTPRGLDVVWGVASGKTGHTWAIANREDPALVCVDSHGSVISTQSLFAAIDAPWHEVAHPIPMHVVGDLVVIGVGEQILSVRESRVEILQTLPSRATSVSGGGPYAAQLIAVGMEVGVAVLRLGLEGSTRLLGPELREPLALLSSGGFLFAADDSTVQVHAIGRRQATRRDDWPCFEASHSTGKPIAVLPAAQSNRFTIVTDAGVVSVYEVSS